MVADPRKSPVMCSRFSGWRPRPDSARCFAPERERFGPADYKIWHTSKVSARSVGRGWSVPVAMMPPPVLEQINELTEPAGLCARR